jgi:alpha-N-acetylglucosamine transferase
MKLAYGTFIFRDSGYLPGLLLIAHKIRELDDRNSAKLICFHTEDIDAKSVGLLNLFYDEVKLIKSLKVGRNRVGRQQPLPHMFTRFQFLNPDNYPKRAPDKVLILDADMLPIKSFNGLFKLSAPAGVINESKDGMKGSIKTDKKIDSWEWHDKYKNTCAHGQLIPSSITDKAFQEPKLNMGINGGLMLLKPSAEDFNSFMKWASDNETIINAMEWPDMQSITAFYSGKWIGIDVKYLGLYGYPNIKSLYGIHFIGPKPWQWRDKGFSYRIKNFPDYKLWAEEFLEMCNKNPTITKMPRLNNLRNAIVNEGI